MKYINILFVLLSSRAMAQEVKHFSDKTVQVYVSTEKTTARLSASPNLHFKPLVQPLETQSCIFVYPARKNQVFLGIGGAITDASAETFAKIPAAKQEELINAYYNKEKGIGYSLMRTNINSCDFSSDNYSYIKEGDSSLTSFSIEHDKKFKIPMIKRAMKVAGKINLFASPWSPPAFMKSNNNMLQGGTLLPAYYYSWAEYYTKFIKAFQNAGIPVWGITIQNEPMATQKWESCIFTAEAERDFLKNYLGPVLAKEQLSKIKVIVWDHNRDLISQRASTIFDDPVAAKYAWGLGFHWYENWSGGEMMYENVGKVHAMYPTKNLLFTEGCAESFDPAKYQNWNSGEKYAKSMINDFNNGTVGWTDWNVLLDETGGPNHVGNFCFAPIHANTQTGELIYTPAYYYIGHFSKFIQPGAKHISSVVSRSQLSSVSFINPDGKIVTVVLNPTETDITYFISEDGNAAEVVIPGRSIQTLIY